MKRRRTRSTRRKSAIKYLSVAPRRRARRSRRRRSLRGDLPIMLAGRKRRHSRRRASMLGSGGISGAFSKANLMRLAELSAGAGVGYFGSMMIAGALDKQPMLTKWAPVAGLLAPAFLKSGRMQNVGLGIAAGSAVHIVSMLIKKYLPEQFESWTDKGQALFGDDLAYIALDAPPSYSAMLEGDVHYGGGALLGSPYMNGNVTPSQRYLSGPTQQSPLGASNSMPLGASNAMPLGNLEQRQVLSGTNALI